jgi:D-glycero-alpha-D-manno-heptose-7-phosphate kinase
MFASVQRLPLGEGVFIRSADQEKTISAESPAALPERGELEFLAAFVRRLVPEGESILLQTDSDIPPGSGLGGSGALGVAVVAALDAAFGRSRSQEDIAELANSVERDDLAYAGGSQDSYGPAIGGVNRLDYHQGGGVTVQKLQVNDATRLALDS